MKTQKLPSLGDQVRAHHNAQASLRLAHNVRTLALQAGADATRAEVLVLQALAAFPPKNGLAAPPPGLTLEDWVSGHLGSSKP